MEDQRLDLGLVIGLDAESFGEPGARTFCVRAKTPEGQVVIWLEKEQIVMLGSALQELLQRVPAGGGTQPGPQMVPVFFGDLEVKAGSLGVGFDGIQEGFTLEVGDFLSQFDLESIHLTATRDQFEHIREQIGTILTASRPRCPLCHTPLTGGPHFCPQSNGHAPASRGE